MKKKIIVFNLSGALLMPMDEVIVVWCRAIRDTGLFPDYAMIYEQFFGEDFSTIIIPNMAEKHGWNGFQVESILHKAKTFFKDLNTSTNADLADKLKSLKEKGYDLGVISNKTLDRLVDGLMAIGCPVNIFDVIKTGEDGIKKPDPRVFDKFLEKYKPEQIVLVGDNKNYDKDMADKASIKFVAIASKLFPVNFWKIWVSEKDVYKSVFHYIDSLLAD